MSNHTPATPLPWKPASGRANEGMGAPVETELRGADRQVAVRLGTLYSDRQKQDADYIAHAANAYPKLVEALADIMRDQLKAVNLHQMAPGPRQRIERARVLLHDLGET